MKTVEGAVNVRSNSKSFFTIAAFHYHLNVFNKVVLASKSTIVRWSYGDLFYGLVLAFAFYVNLFVGL